MPDANHSAEADDGIRPVPEGYRAVTSWIDSSDTARLFDFVKEAFGAREGWPDTPGFFRLHFADGDAVYRRALEAVSVTEMTHLFFGDRVGREGSPGQRLVDSVARRGGRS